jgi:hypothetical protein
VTKCATCAKAGRVRCSCSRRTSPKVRAHLRAIAAKGGHAAGRWKQRQARQRWAEIVKGMTVSQAWRHVYEQGYNCGFMVGRRSGYAQGWEACAQTQRGRVRAA